MKCLVVLAAFLSVAFSFDPCAISCAPCTNCDENVHKEACRECQTMLKAKDEKPIDVACKHSCAPCKGAKCNPSLAAAECSECTTVMAHKYPNSLCSKSCSPCDNCDEDLRDAACKECRQADKAKCMDSSCVKKQCPQSCAPCHDDSCDPTLAAAACLDCTIAANANLITRFDVPIKLTYDMCATSCAPCRDCDHKQHQEACHECRSVMSEQAVKPIQDVCKKSCAPCATKYCNHALAAIECSECTTAMALKDTNNLCLKSCAPCTGCDEKLRDASCKECRQAKQSGCQDHACVRKQCSTSCGRCDGKCDIVLAAAACFDCTVAAHSKYYLMNRDRDEL